MAGELATVYSAAVPPAQSYPPPKLAQARQRALAPALVLQIKFTHLRGGARRHPGPLLFRK
jgi:hypothetical protein